MRLQKLPPAPPKKAHRHTRLAEVSALGRLMATIKQHSIVALKDSQPTED